MDNNNLSIINLTFIVNLVSFSMLIDSTFNLNQLCEPCIGNKSTCIIIHKNLLPISCKLEKVHADL